MKSWTQYRDAFQQHVIAAWLRRHSVRRSLGPQAAMRAISSASKIQRRATCSNAEWGTPLSGEWFRWLNAYLATFPIFSDRMRALIEYVRGAMTATVNIEVGNYAAESQVLLDRYKA